MRAALAALPDGTWRFADVVDSFGPGADQQVPTHVRVGARRSTATSIAFDFTGSDPQRAGNVNAVEAVTVSAVRLRPALRARPDAAGQRRCAAAGHVVADPPGTIVAARPPAAVGAGNVEVEPAGGRRRASAPWPRPCPGGSARASQGTMNNVLIGGARAWVYYETVAGGQGGRGGGRAAA